MNSTLMTLSERSWTNCLGVRKSMATNSHWSHLPTSGLRSSWSRPEEDDEEDDEEEGGLGRINWGVQRVNQSL